MSCNWHTRPTTRTGLQKMVYKNCECVLGHWQKGTELLEEGQSEGLMYTVSIMHTVHSVYRRDRSSSRCGPSSKNHQRGQGKCRLFIRSLLRVGGLEHFPIFFIYFTLTEQGKGFWTQEGSFKIFLLVQSHFSYCQFYT